MHDIADCQIYPLSFPLGCRVGTVTTTFPLPCSMNSLELLTQLRSHIGWEVRKTGYARCVFS